MNPIDLWQCKIGQKLKTSDGCKAIYLGHRGDICGNKYSVVCYSTLMRCSFLYTKEGKFLLTASAYHDIIEIFPYHPSHYTDKVAAEVLKSMGEGGRLKALYAP